MQYFALLISQERDLTPDERATEMAAYQGFHAKAASAIRAGDALLPRGDRGAHHRRPGRADHHRRPIRRRRRGRGRLLRVRGRKPRRGIGFGARHPGRQVRRRGDLADDHSPSLSRQPLGRHQLARTAAGTTRSGRCRPARRSGRRWRRGTVSSRAAAGDHIVGGAALHEPSTATTVRVRDGEVLITDGPYAEGAEIATGFYLLTAGDRDEAVKLAVDDPRFCRASCGSWPGSPACSVANGQPGRRLPPGVGTRRRRARAVVRRPHRRRGRRPGSLRRGASHLARATVCPTIPAGGW